MAVDVEWFKITPSVIIPAHVSVCLCVRFFNSPGLPWKAVQWKERGRFVGKRRVKKNQRAVLAKGREVKERSGGKTFDRAVSQRWAVGGATSDDAGSS